MSLGQQIQSRANQAFRAHQIPAMIHQARMQDVFNDQIKDPMAAKMMGDMYSPNKDRADAGERALQRYQAMLELGHKQAQVAAAQANLSRQQNDSYLKNLRGGLGTLNTLTGSEGVFRGADPTDIQTLMYMMQLKGVPTTPFTNNFKNADDSGWLPEFNWE